MKAVFVGGGSFRTLPIVRTAMAEKEVFSRGAISLVDLNLSRAETVGRLIKKTPEFQGSGCEVSWTNKLDEALPGADFVSACFPVVPFATEEAGIEACYRHGFWGSDQMSLNGAFRAMRGGMIIQNIAKRMEKHCPDARLTIFANPVAVYSGYVNNHTRIKALGICFSCYHHRWDLTRILFEKDECRDDYKIASAGINHLNFILRGEYKGRDLYKLLDQKFNEKGWKPCRIPTLRKAEKQIHLSFNIFRDMRRRFGYIPSANEHDGLGHLYFEKIFSEFYEKMHTPKSMAEIKRQERASRTARNRIDNEFRSHLDRELNSAFWSQAHLENPHFAPAPDDPTAVILKALGTGKPQWLSASLPNRGVLKGFTDRSVVDYSFTLDKRGIHPDRGLEVPACFHGLISALSMHQTLLGDTIATLDPRVFANALFAYPIYQNTKRAKSLWSELLKIYARDIPAELQKAKDYF